jgi:hypothetical protein
MYSHTDFSGYGILMAVTIHIVAFRLWHCRWVPLFWRNTASPSGKAVFLMPITTHHTNKWPQCESMDMWV